MNCVDLDSRSAAGTLSLAHCYAIYSICTGWLQLVFHFGTENRADQLKKTTLYVVVNLNFDNVRCDDGLLAWPSFTC